MKTHKLPLLLLFCFLALTSPAQSTLQEFKSGAARFAIRAGNVGPKFSSDFARTDKYYIPSDTFSWAEADAVVSVLHMTPWLLGPNSGKLTPAVKAQIRAMVEGQFEGSFKNERASFQKLPFMVNGSSGTEYLVAGENRSIVRIFFINERLYVLIASVKGPGDFQRQKSLLSSFRYLPEAEFFETVLKESTPAELPQIIPNGILPTDSIELGLKGTVKEILEEMESGPAKKRVRSGFEEFNKNGYLTKRIVYFNGRPDSITLFGWVDGNRAVNVGPISYRGEGWNFANSSRTLVGQGAPEGYNIVGRDLTGSIVDRRYTTRFEVKFDDEWRVKERTHLTSAGEKSLVEKVIYSREGRDVKTEDNSGGFITRRFHVLDNNGQIVEERTLDDRGGIVSSVHFRYEFDPKGNWILKKEFSGRRSNLAALKPTATYYRTITYYD